MRCSVSIGAVLLLSLLPACARPGDSELGDPGRQPATSGLARYRDRLLLAVHDTKRGQEGPRLSVVSFARGLTPELRPLVVDWDRAGGIPADLESICPVPDRRGEYLVVESGHRDGLTGRIIRLRVSGESLAEVRADVAGALDLPADVRSIEGAALWRRGEAPLILVICERNERKATAVLKEGEEERYALLQWFVVDLDRERLEPLYPTRVRALVWPEGGRLRTCSDLYLEQGEGGATLWIAATVEPGDEDRHDSIVYRLALDDPLAEGAGESTMEVVWRIRGSKVEGLASPLSSGDGLTIATDEDELGGEIRVLPRPISPAKRGQVSHFKIDTP
jgi:hypothetical protein